MFFPQPLVEARLIRRYKRFLADVTLPDGTTAIAHCANPGAMIGLARECARVWVAPSPNPKSKLAWRWHLEDVKGCPVAINTTLANGIVAEALHEGRIHILRDYKRIMPEYTTENARLDFCLMDGDAHCFVEVKSVTLKIDDCAAFPDSVTKRGLRHLHELARLRALGHRAVLLWLVMRSDCNACRAAHEYDPAYASEIKAIQESGVELLAYDTNITLDAITLGSQLPIQDSF